MHTDIHSEAAKALLTRVEAAIAARPVNAPRFCTFRDELTTALDEGGSYLSWTLADWSEAIEGELRWHEARRAEGLAA